MGKPRPNQLRFIAIATVLAVAIFLLDLSLPLGVAGGVPYVALVLLGWWSSKPRYIVLFATVSTVLTVTGYYHSPEGGIHWIVLTNRLLAFFAIWVTAALLVIVKRAETALQIAHEKLEQRAKAALQESEHSLQQRVAELEDAQDRLEQQGEALAQLADDLSLARDQAEAANQAKSEFLAAMSHELRTPLNAVIGFSEIIKDETFGPVGSTRYRDYANDINQSGQHLLDLINDILDLSKVEAGVDELHEEDIDIRDLTRAVFTLVGERARRESTKLELDLADDLPLLRADERKLKQILVNLLSNAIKFTEAGGLITLKAWCRSDSGFVFQVIDTGIGIAPEDIQKALSQFGQVDSDLNRQYDGTGLGLPLTKCLAELHGGGLDLQSQVGVGTTATIRLPASRIVKPPVDLHALGVADREAG